MLWQSSKACLMVYSTKYLCLQQSKQGSHMIKCIATLLRFYCIMIKSPAIGAVAGGAVVGAILLTVLLVTLIVVVTLIIYNKKKCARESLNPLRALG